jgi:hypothetical protein
MRCSEVCAALVEGTPGDEAWVAVAWSLGILVVFYTLALSMYRWREPVTAPQ